MTTAETLVLDNSKDILENGMPIHNDQAKISPARDIDTSLGVGLLGLGIIQR